MKLRELLDQLMEVSDKIGTSTPFICGGTPRDRFMNRLDHISDIDITTGDKSVDYLSQEFAIHLQKKYNITRKTMDDGHSSIFIGNLKLDFSSNFVVPNIDSLLNSKEINNPTDLQKEMFSRDFTCNALLLSLNLKEIRDSTSQGFKDIKDKKIKTCLDPKITLTSNKNRVIRSIYLACKLQFDIDEGIINTVKNNPEIIKISTNKSINDKLIKAFSYDSDKAAMLLSKMNLWEYIQVSKEIYPFYIKYTKQKGLV